MSDAVFVESLVTELNMAVGGGKQALQKVTALEGRVGAIEGGKPKAHVVETWTSGNNWYRKWSDGYIEQGGLTTQATYDAVVTISLPTAFKNLNYVAISSVGDSNKNNLEVAEALLWHATRTLTSFKAAYRQRTSGSGQSPYFIYWYACGY